MATQPSFGGDNTGQPCHLSEKTRGKCHSINEVQSEQLVRSGINGNAVVKESDINENWKLQRRFRTVKTSKGVRVNVKSKYTKGGIGDIQKCTLRSRIQLPNMKICFQSKVFCLTKYK